MTTSMAQSKWPQSREARGLRVENSVRHTTQMRGAYVLICMNLSNGIPDLPYYHRFHKRDFFLILQFFSAISEIILYF
jgi:hypothetical protein